MTSEQFFKQSFPKATCKRGPDGWWVARMDADKPYASTSRRKSWAWAEAVRKLPELLKAYPQEKD